MHIPRFKIGQTLIRKGTKDHYKVIRIYDNHYDLINTNTGYNLDYVNGLFVEQECNINLSSLLKEL